MIRRKWVIEAVSIFLFMSVLTSGCKSKEIVQTNNTDSVEVTKGDESTKDEIIQKNAVKKATDDEIIRAKDLYKDFLNKYNDEEVIAELILVDLNDDRIPELISGSFSKTYSPIKISLTIEDGNLAELKVAGDYGVSGSSRSSKNYEIVNIGMPVFESLKAYKDKNTNEMIFIGKDISANNVDEGVAGDYTISLNNGVLNTKEIFFKDHSEDIKKYRYMNNDVSQNELKNKTEEYYSNLEELELNIYSKYINLQRPSECLEEGFLKFLSKTQIDESSKYVKTDINSDGNVVKEAEVGITKEEAIKIAEDMNGTHMQYGCEGRVQAGFKIDGKPSEDYYKVYGLVDGQRLSGAIYVHYKTGKAYLLSTDGTITTLPDNIYVGNFGDK